MEIISLLQDNYGKWDEFCMQSDDAWFWHTSKWLEYTLNYNTDLNSTSLSFIVIEDDRILAVCLLLLETIKFNNRELREFSFGGSPIWAPALANYLSRKRRGKVMAAIFEHVDMLASLNQVARASFRLCPLAPRFLSSELPINNYLMKYSYMDISLNTQIIDLTHSLHDIRADMRKGHKYDINRGLKELDIDIFDKSNTSKEDFNMYRILHHKASGRITRPMVTFDMQYDWLLQGNAVLLGARLHKEYVGFSYIFTYKKRAFYGSACNDPDYPKAPIGHVLQWGTINWLKENKYKYYEIGMQRYSYQAYDFPPQDEINIFHYQRGLGGFTIPYFRGEKFYEHNYCLDVFSERLNEYVSYLENTAHSSAAI